MADRTLTSRANLGQPSCPPAVWEIFIHRGPAVLRTQWCREREGRGDSGIPTAVLCPGQLSLALRITDYETLRFWWNRNKSFTEKCTETSLFAFSLLYSIENEWLWHIRGWAQESDSYLLKYLALSCTSCVALDRLLIVFMPQFADLSKGILVLPW